MTGLPTQGRPPGGPLDLAAVAADDAALEALRAGDGAAAVGDDLALLLVRELLRDVRAEPVGAPALHLVGPAPERSRRAQRAGAVAVALTAGVLSLGGVAAAAGLPVDGPLRSVGEAVRTAAGAVAGAVTPVVDQPVLEPVVEPARPALPEPAAPTAATARSAPGAAALAARAAGAERAVTSLLDSAARQLAAGRPGPAAAMLDTAERRLAEVPAVAVVALSGRLAELRDQVAAAVDPDRGRTQEPPDRPPPGLQRAAVREPAPSKPVTDRPAAGLAPKGRRLPEPAGPASSR